MTNHEKNALIATVQLTTDIFKRGIVFSSMFECNVNTLKALEKFAKVSGKDTIKRSTVANMFECTSVNTWSSEFVKLRGNDTDQYVAFVAVCLMQCQGYMKRPDDHWSCKQLT